jgi:single-strand DNA-binding protein
MGNITRDPELRNLPGGTAVCSLGLAVNRKWKDKSGEEKEEVTFVDCESFGNQAEVLTKYKKKGDPLFIVGRLKLDQWEDKEGQKRTKLKVIIENFQFLNKGGNNAGDDAPAENAHRESARAAAKAGTAKVSPPPKALQESAAGAGVANDDLPF